LANHHNPHDVFKYIKFPLQEGGQLVPHHNEDGTVNKDGCWLWEGATGGRDKRPLFGLNGRRVTAYRLVWELTHGVMLAPDELLLHECDTPQCCCPDHLRVGTPGQNMKDMVLRERVGMTKRQVQEIMKMIDLGFMQSHIAKHVGKSRRLISDIANRTRYRDVPWPGRDEDDKTVVHGNGEQTGHSSDDVRRVHGDVVSDAAGDQRGDDVPDGDT
jgi:hypothetical protein